MSIKSILAIVSIGVCLLCGAAALAPTEIKNSADIKSVPTSISEVPVEWASDTPGVGITSVEGQKYAVSMTKAQAEKFGITDWCPTLDVNTSALLAGVGACCYHDAWGWHCQTAMPQYNCEVGLSGTWHEGATCSSGVCNGACCLPNGTCQILSPEDCYDGGENNSQKKFWGPGTTCNAQLCWGACCGGGTCTESLDVNECAAAKWKWVGWHVGCNTVGVNYTGLNCAAVCKDCMINPQWYNEFCDPNYPAYACCINGNCMLASEATCLIAGGTWHSGYMCDGHCDYIADCGSQ